MDGEDKSAGSKRRSKSVGTGLDSDDDEPIRSLFKLKKARNLKKANVGLYGGGDRGKKVVEEKEVDIQGDLGGMDDTLANFRKRLKGPKRSVGSGIMQVKHSASNLPMVSSEVSLSETLEEMSDKRPSSSVTDDVKVRMVDSGSVSTIDVPVKNRCGREAMAQIQDFNSERIEGHVSHKHVEVLEIGCTMKNQEGLTLSHVNNVKHFSSDTKDSLSELFQKSLLATTRKSLSSSSLKRISGNQMLDGDFIPCPEDVLDTKEAVNASNTTSFPVSEFERNQKSAGKCLPYGSGLCLLSAVSEALNERFNDSCSQKEDKHDLCISNVQNCVPKHVNIGDAKQFSFASARKATLPYHPVIEDGLNCCSTDDLRSVVSGVDFTNDFVTGIKDQEEKKFGSTVGFDNEVKVLDHVLGSSGVENAVIQDKDKLVSTRTSNRDKDSRFTSHHPDKLLETVVYQSESVASIPNSRSDILEKDPSEYAMKEENGEVSPTLTNEDETGSQHGDSLSMPDIANKNTQVSAVQRAVRKAKKCRHGDMAYEGDADWEVLINQETCLEKQSILDGCRTQKMKENPASCEVAEKDGIAAVSVGLKAHAASPVEKIKFKEMLKRKGGLQQYLECRNQILRLWNKDITRILPVADCGVDDCSREDETPHASLIRDVYAFLDQCGYINVGIASQKGKEKIDTTHNYKLVEEKKIGGRSGASVAETEDGVSFIVGRAKHLDIARDINNDANKDGGTQPQKVCEAIEHERKVTIELANRAEIEENHAGNDEVNVEFGKQPPAIVDVDLSSGSSCMVALCKTAVTTSAQWSESVHFQTAPDGHRSEKQHSQCYSGAQKNIIVIGAGPAGLTAARHLQRQGFSVTVLEGRSRIGGRVFTDHSSLSVPVDLGASIITGVEADVATERRPDPSSLICAQLGLELTVLNSDCPLYDIITGEKVPADLDEALEAEYNSLLDDMLLLVAQKGEHAERMSLEEGLEYALPKRRNMACSGRAVEEIELHNLADQLPDPKREHCEVEILSPLERRVMNWHFANLEYGCAALLSEVSLPYWNQDDLYGGFGGAHCMIKGGYGTVIESLGEGLDVHLNNVVTDVSYWTDETGALGGQNWKVKICTSNGNEFLGDAVLITVPLGCLKAETIKFTPPLPDWKRSAIQRLGFGVLNKVVLEFPEIFWDDSVDYFGATAEDTDRRGHCFMFWNVRKTVGAPVLIALVVGKAAIDGENLSSCDHINRALIVLRKLFGEARVPDPVASVVTDWGRDPFTYGAYSYVAVGASGDDYDILGKPVENCLFFAGEATCKEHPDTVGGAMMSGLREAVHMIDLMSYGKDYTAEVEAMEAAQRELDSERDEVRDIMKRLDAIELANALYKKSMDGDQILILKDIFFDANTNAGRLCLAKKLLSLPVEAFKSFAGTKEGLTILNSWILDSMGKDGTQLLRHCVRILVLVSTDLLAVRLSGIGKTVKEKVCVHTSRDIRARASQLVSVWLEVFRKEKTANGGLRLARQASAVDSSRRKSLRDSSSSKPPLHTHHVVLENNKGGSLDPLSGGSDSSSIPDMGRANDKKVRQHSAHESKQEPDSSRYTEDDNHCHLSEEEQAAIAAAEAARAKALAAAEAYALETRRNSSLQLPRIPSFHKFARREQYVQNDECDSRRIWSGGVLGRQDCISEIDSRNCRVRDWSLDFSAACVNLQSSRMSIDNLPQRSHSNDIACHLREHSGESAAADNSFLTKAWIDSSEGVGIKDYHAIERWQSQAAAADCDFSQSNMHIKDEEDSNASSRLPTWKYDKVAKENSISQVTVNRGAIESHPLGADRIKQAVEDYVAALLMPLYKARKLDKEGYKGIMKRSVTKVMEKATDAEKAMAVHEFLDFKRKNKIRPFVDKLIERHMVLKPHVRP